MMQDGRAFLLYGAELQQAIEDAGQFGELKKPARQLKEALDRLQQATQHLLEVAQAKGAELFLADATLYLEFFGIITVAWQWLLQGIAVQKALQNGVKEGDVSFYEGKMMTLQDFFAYELPKTLGLEKRLLESDGLTVQTQLEHFND
jgi:butyryl-CoA dehydrogenase